MSLDTLPLLNISDTDVIEEGVITFAEKVGDLLQSLISECGLEEVVGAVGVEVQFFEQLKLGSATEEVGGFTSVWVSPTFLEGEFTLDGLVLSSGSGADLSKRGSTSNESN